jgi:hypothetical protein
MRRTPEVLLALVVLVSCQGCGSCVGESSPTEQKDPVSVSPPAKPAVPIDPKFLKTRVKDTALTLDATAPESVIPDGALTP